MLSNDRIEQRRAGLGGSDIAAALGLSPYKSPFDLYQEKLGLVEPPDLSNNDAVHFGNVLEDVVADEFARRLQVKVRRSNQHLVHRDFEFLLANIDRSVVGKPLGLRCGLECKTADKWAAKPDLWGPGAWFDHDDDGNLQLIEHDDQVPDWYLLQCVHYMAVTDSDLWFLAVLIGGNDFRIYTIHRDKQLESMVISRAMAFWQCVQTEIPPEPVNVSDMESMFPVDNGKGIPADDDTVNAWVEAKELQAQLKAIETRLEGQTVGKTKVGGLKNKLRMAIGENAELLYGPEGKTIASWKAPKSGRQVFDMEAFKREHPQLAREYTKKVPGSRVLLIK